MKWKMTGQINQCQHCFPDPSRSQHVPVYLLHPFKTLWSKPKYVTTPDPHVSLSTHGREFRQETQRWTLLHIGQSRTVSSRAKRLLTGRQKGSLPSTWCTVLTWSSSPLLRHQGFFSLLTSSKKRSAPLKRHRQQLSHMQKMLEGKRNAVSEF